MQKFSARPLLLSAGWLALSAFCFGDTVTVASSAGETMNSSGMPTLAVNPVDPLWASPFAGSSWVSYVNSGNPAMPNFVSPPNGTSVIFTDTFDINGTPSSGTLNVFADDSASVTLNGILLMPLASASGNTYKVCSDSPIGCLSNTGAIVNLTSALLPGINTLSFDVVQEAGVGYGLDYAGTINYSMPAVITATPEPATFALLGLPLAALFAWRRRRA